MEKDYAKIAKETRLEVLKMIHRAKTSHIASNFSAVDLAVVLYENADHSKDKICWSKGWSAALIYSLLARHGFIPKEDLDKFPNAPYLGLVEPPINGIYGAGGSMGHLLPIAVGMALGKKLKGEEGKIYCVMSDGELNEGTTWESAALASHHKLDNLVVLIDANKWQAMGRTSEVLNFEPIENVWRGFKWYVERVDGHNYQELDGVINARFHWPTAIICDTIKGKGVLFFENSLLYHYKNVSDEEYEKAMLEL